jgi:hypothetical protein
MDMQKLRSQAASRRNEQSEQKEPEISGWKCEYCQKSFARESTFMRHSCRERERAIELKSFVGQKAYGYYGEWMKQRHRSVPKIETFATSQYYTSFVKFAKWAEQVNLPSITNYIKVMIDQGFDNPHYWVDAERHAMYLEWYDNAKSPQDAFVDSIEYIESYLESNHVTGNVFEHLGIRELGQLIKKRKISMWFVLASPACKDFIIRAKSDPDFNQFISAYDVNAWGIRIKNNTAMIKEFAEVCKAMNL